MAQCLARKWKPNRRAFCKESDPEWRGYAVRRDGEDEARSPCEEEIDTVRSLDGSHHPGGLCRPPGGFFLVGRRGEGGGSSRVGSPARGAAGFWPCGHWTESGVDQRSRQRREGFHSRGVCTADDHLVQGADGT